MKEKKKYLSVGRRKKCANQFLRIYEEWIKEQRKNGTKERQVI